MKRLILMRHAKAVPAGTMPDHDRPLAPRGLRDAAAAGEAIARAGWTPQRALVSDAVRTRQTFDAAAAALDPKPDLDLQPALFGATVATILDAIAATAPEVDGLLAIGHNPGIAAVARRLATSGAAKELARLGEGFPTATVAVIALPGSWDAVAEGGTLEALVLTG